VENQKYAPVSRHPRAFSARHVANTARAHAQALSEYTSGTKNKARLVAAFEKLNDLLSPPTPDNIPVPE
jgi:hypothetical protein